MSGKSISTGTLSLRFMQNAHRAKQLKEVELDRAVVQDDGKWEVSQAIRNAWGLQRDSDSLSKDVHESSYLPFIFSSTSSVEVDDRVPEAPSRKIAGRRTFNNKGEEVSQSDSTPAVDQLSGSPTTAEAFSETPSNRKIHQRPISISALGTSSGQLKGFEQKESKTARQAIFENGGVGTDLRAPTRKNAIASTSTTFMKPAGVDEPKNVHVLPSSSSGSIEGAQLKQIKRERESGEERSDSKKKLKKRKSE